MKTDPMAAADEMPSVELEAEKGYIGAILQRQDILDELLVADSDLYDQANRAVLQLAMEMHAGGSSIDLIKLRSLARKKFTTAAGAGLTAQHVIARAAEAYAATPAPSNAPHYAALIRDAAIKRDLRCIGAKTLHDANDPSTEARDLLNWAEQEIFAARDRRAVASSRTIEAPNLMVEAMAAIDARLKGGPPGTPTGYGELDEIVRIMMGMLLILAARPGMGKTAFALNIAMHMAEVGLAVLYISLEMSAIELADRMLSSHSQVDGEKLRAGRLTAEERARLVMSAAELSKLPLMVDDSSSLKMVEIAAMARRAKRKHPNLGLVVIDYLQLIEPENTRDNREQQVGRIAKKLKELARELSVPVLCLAQLNRQTETTKDNRPRLSHLRESGAIEQDADVVMFVHRPEYFFPHSDVPAGLRGKAEIIVAKNRQGRVTDVKLDWHERTTTFKNPADAPQLFE